MEPASQTCGPAWIVQPGIKVKPIFMTDQTFDWNIDVAENTKYNCTNILQYGLQSAEYKSTFYLPGTNWTNGQVTLASYIIEAKLEWNAE